MSDLRREAFKILSDDQSEQNNLKTFSNQETSCNLDNEITPEDEQVFKHLKLTDEQLKLKKTDKEAFWKSIAESVRCELSDALEDNQEVCSFYF
jgi:hypothetical protein